MWARARRRQLYVMETKMAEASLSTEESHMWEQMKQDYIASRGLDDGKGSGAMPIPTPEPVRVRRRARSEEFQASEGATSPEEEEEQP